MKKNITINLFGTLYNIDEDACQLLEQYIESMKSYFSRQEGGEEIADDIEHRVAELLWQQKQQGVEAVNIDHIRQIIRTIGNPAEIDDRPEDASWAREGKDEADSSTSEAEDATYEEVKDGEEHKFRRFANEAGDAMKKACKEGRNFVRGRHLYRDGNDKLLGGVLSGMAKYFDVTDPIWFRLGFLFLVLFLPPTLKPFNYISGFWIFAYILLWIIVPEATTAEDVLRMKGEKVTPESLNEEILRQNEDPSPKRDVPQQVRHSGCLRILFVLMVALLLFPFILMLLGVVITGGALLAVGKESLPLFDIFGNDFTSFLTLSQNGAMWLCVVSAFLVAGIPIYFLIRSLRTVKKPLSTITIVLSLVLWLVSVVTTIGTVIYTTENYDSWRRNRTELLQ